MQRKTPADAVKGTIGMITYEGQDSVACITMHEAVLTIEFGQEASGVEVTERMTSRQASEMAHAVLSTYHPNMLMANAWHGLVAIGFTAGTAVGALLAVLSRGA